MSDVALKPCDLHEWLVADYDAGTLRWRKSPGQRGVVGVPVGRLVTKGYLRFALRGRTYAVHSVLFAMHHGRWPAHQIDHINGDKTDNHITNLREATNQQNAFNRPSKNRTTGTKGVTLHRGRFIARIMVDGKAKHLGCFGTADEARLAYATAAHATHGDFANTGVSP